MKILASVDDDGHFQLHPINDDELAREKLLDHLAMFENCAMWANEAGDALDAEDLIEQNLKYVAADRFIDFLSHFEARHRMEVVDLNLSLTINI